jgi:predicted AAA+ superfamily ATPase
MPRQVKYTRHVAANLRAALRDTPTVLIHGPRQCGKTTLANEVGGALKYTYLTFDDDSLRIAALSDPVGFVEQLPNRTILDEIQRVPELFTSLKAVVDRHRTPGRFILTGSANVLLLPRLADSLAGRIGVLRLHPLSQSELEGSRPRFLHHLFNNQFRTKIFTPTGIDLFQRIARGGFPAALARRDPSRQRAWYRDYVEAHIQRDVRDLSRIRSFDTLPKLVRLIAAHTARLQNIAELAAPFELTRQSIHDHVTLLERVFLVDRLPPWHSNELSRLVKRSKLHISDTGLACAVMGLSAPQLASNRLLLGPLLETFVLQELRRQSSSGNDPVDFYHYRDRDDYEVDIVLESNNSLAAIEVKAASSVQESDLRGLRKLRSAAGNNFACGVVLYNGTVTIRFQDNLWAVPIESLWE